MSFFKQALLGFSWIGALRLSIRLVTLGKLAILARLLTPAQFGLFGIATLVLAFLEIISETGINVFLIQEKVSLKKYLDVAWLVSILRGCLISFLIISTIPFVSAFFRSPESHQILWLVSLVPALRGFINPAVVRFQKELQFGREFGYRLLVFCVEAVFAVVLALKLHSAVALVFGLWAGALAEIVFSHLMIAPHPRLAWDRAKIGKVLNRGKWLTAAGFFNYLFGNLDNAAVGRMLDVASLGLYQNAYKIAALPLTEVSEVIKKVTFPIYVQFAAEKSRLRQGFYQSLGVTAILTIPLGMIFLFFPELIIRLILGEAWLPAAPVLRVLSFLGVVRALIATAYPLFLSLKLQKIVSFSTLAATVGLGLTLIPLVARWGIVGAAMAALIGSLCEIPVIVYYLVKVLR